MSTAFDLTELRDLIAAREVSATEVAIASFARLDDVDALLGIMLERFTESALAAAKETDRALAAGDTVGPLAGVPIGIKAMLACREAVPTAQSVVHDPSWWAGRDAPTVAALRSAGATLLGHTTMVEHAMGRPDPSKPFPIPRNPWDPQRWPGGSSSGTGIGIAAGVFAGGLGTDTGGSVRIPSAMCGVTGLKTTRALLSTEGCLPAARSLDVIGPMARSARDLRILMNAMSSSFSASARPATRRIAVVNELMVAERGVTEHVADRMREGLAVLEDAGYVLESVALPEFDELMSLTLTIMIAEVFAHHADGLRTRWRDYGRSFRRLAVMGGVVSEERYKAALARAAELRGTLSQRFAAFDAIAMPTWPTGALSYFSNGGTPAEQTNFTAPWNAVGFPAISLPVGVAESGMPIGLQLVGTPCADAVLIGVGEDLQRRSDWHHSAPEIRPGGTVTTIPDPDADTVIAGPGLVAAALREHGFPLDEIDAAIVDQVGRTLMA